MALSPFSHVGEMERDRSTASHVIIHRVNLSSLPALNAGLNAMSALLLVLGYTLIRQRAITGHTVCMLAATSTSCLFLVSYIYYHAHHGATPFPGNRAHRPWPCRTPG